MKNYNNFKTGFQKVQGLIKDYIQKHPKDYEGYPDDLEDDIYNNIPQPHNHSRRFLASILWEIGDMEIKEKYSSPLDITYEAYINWRNEQCSKITIS